MQNEIDVLLDVATRLDRAGIPYMLTGSLALNCYAEPRMTRDIDLVVELRAEDTPKVAALFAEDYVLSEDAIRSAIARRSLFNLIHQESVIKVDLIVRKGGAFRLGEFARRRQVEIRGTPIWVVSKEDLILSKLWWAKDSHSAVQLRDIRRLLASGCDKPYIEHWVSRMELGQVWEEALRD